MDATVRQHIERLEKGLHDLAEMLMAARSTKKRNELDAQIRAVNAAIAHYRAALEIESKIGNKL